MNAGEATFWEHCFPRLAWSSDDAGKGIAGKRTVMLDGDDGPEVWIVSNIRIHLDGEGCRYIRSERIR